MRFSSRFFRDSETTAGERKCSAPGKNFPGFEATKMGGKTPAITIKLQSRQCARGECPDRRKTEMTAHTTKAKANRMHLETRSAKCRTVYTCTEESIFATADARANPPGSVFGTEAGHPGATGTA